MEQDNIIKHGAFHIQHGRWKTTGSCPNPSLETLNLLWTLVLNSRCFLPHLIFSILQILLASNISRNCVHPLPIKSQYQLYQHSIYEVATTLSLNDSHVIPGCLIDFAMILSGIVGWCSVECPNCWCIAATKRGPRKDTRFNEQINDWIVLVTLL
jgi:hypothetical protein